MHAIFCDVSKGVSKEARDPSDFNPVFSDFTHVVNDGSKSAENLPLSLRTAAPRVQASRATIARLLDQV